MTDLWGPISESDWRTTPCIVGRPATENDVAAGHAVFYIQGESVAAPMVLPCCAVQTFEDGSEELVVIVQAELGDQGTILGVRYLPGGNGICLADEVRLLPDGFKTSGGA